MTADRKRKPRGVALEGVTGGEASDTERVIAEEAADAQDSAYSDSDFIGDLSFVIVRYGDGASIDVEHAENEKYTDDSIRRSSRRLSALHVCISVLLFITLSLLWSVIDAPSHAGVTFDVSGTGNGFAGSNEYALRASGEALVVSFYSDTVEAGDTVTLRMKGEPMHTYRITVYLSSGVSQNAALTDQTADSIGNLEWIWSISANTAPGAYRVTVADTDPDEGVMLELALNVN